MKYFDKLAILLVLTGALAFAGCGDDSGGTMDSSVPDATPDSDVPDATPEESPGRIVFGLSAVRNVGEGLVELIEAERTANGPFADFYDFAERCDTMVLNKRTVESLIKAGAFDALGHPRKGLLHAHEQIIEHTVARRKEHDMGVMSLFGESTEGPDFDERAVVSDVEFDKNIRLAFEKEMLGLYVSDHPLRGCSVTARTDHVRTDSTSMGSAPPTLSRTSCRNAWSPRCGPALAVFIGMPPPLPPRANRT